MIIILEILICSPTFYGIVKRRSVEEFKPDPYIATVLNCAFWVFYGMPFVHPNSILVLTINSVGLGFEFVYLTIYYIYATSKGRVRIPSLSLCSFISTFSLYNTWSHFKCLESPIFSYHLDL